MQDGMMSPDQLALARSRAYWLFAELCRQGVTATTLPLVRALPELAPHLPEPFEPDEAAAAHYRLFALNVLAYEAVFLAPEGLLEGPVTEAVAASYREGGWRAATLSASPDSLSSELAYLAFLCGAEADAWRDELPEAASRAADHQRIFLSRHLLRWLPAVTVALRHQADPFYAAMADLLLGLVATHADGWQGLELAFTLPAAPDLLSDEKTGLRDIAEALASPPISGLFLSRDAIGSLARRQNLPQGFAGRAQLLVNAWRAAATFDGVLPFAAALRETAQAWDQDYAEIGEMYPPLEPVVMVWRRRVAETVAWLAGLAQRIETEGLDD